eukprot:UN11013
MGISGSYRCFNCKYEICTDCKNEGPPGYVNGVPMPQHQELDTKENENPGEPNMEEGPKSMYPVVGSLYPRVPNR